MLFKRLYSGVYADDCAPFNQLLLDGGRVEAVVAPEELRDGLDAALIIWGGADINPVYYKHPRHSTTYPGGARDRVEWSLMQRAIELGMPIIAVCSGAQMACAAAGGFLLQDVRDHGRYHQVMTFDGKTLDVNSLHHQMMAGLEMTDHILLAWREGRHGAPYGYMDDKVWEAPESFKEPEFVYFNNIRAYAIQWHPEMMDDNCPATKYILDYIVKKEKENNDGYARTVLTCDC